MLHDNNLIEMSLRLNSTIVAAIPYNTRTARYWKKTSDKRRHTTTEKFTIKFHGRTAKANTNFYI